MTADSEASTAGTDTGAGAVGACAVDTSAGSAGTTARGVFASKFDQRLLGWWVSNLESEKPAI